MVFKNVERNLSITVMMYPKPQLWLVPLVLSICSSISYSDVTIRVCEVDANIPFDGRPIMVGTRLKIIVSSDTAVKDWSGALLTEGQNPERPLATIRPGEPLAAILPLGYIETWDDGYFSGCVIWSGGTARSADWAFAEYTANEIGECQVKLFTDPDWDNEVDSYTFSHTYSRDFNSDHVVNFEDFALFIYYWQNGIYAEQFDLDDNSLLDMNDFAQFIDYWLERT